MPSQGEGIHPLAYETVEEEADLRNYLEENCCWEARKECLRLRQLSTLFRPIIGDLAEELSSRQPAVFDQISSG